MNNFLPPDNTMTAAHAGNVLASLDRKARKLYPDMPERLQRAVMVKEFERLHEYLILRYIKQGLRC